MEGSHGAALEPVAGAAGRVVVLDVAPLVCAWRILRRRFRGDPRLAATVPDGWRDAVSARFLWFALWRFPRGFERELRRLEAAAPGRVRRLRGRAGIAAWRLPDG